MNPGEDIMMVDDLLLRSQSQKDVKLIQDDRIITIETGGRDNEHSDNAKQTVGNDGLKCESKRK